MFAKHSYSPVIRYSLTLKALVGDVRRNRLSLEADACPH